jgi:hypothetical protein
MAPSPSLGRIRERSSKAFYSLTTNMFHLRSKYDQTKGRPISTEISVPQTYSTTVNGSLPRNNLPLPGILLPTDDGSVGANSLETKTYLRNESLLPSVCDLCTQVFTDPKLYTRLLDTKTFDLLGDGIKVIIVCSSLYTCPLGSLFNCDGRIPKAHLEIGVKFWVSCSMLGRPGCGPYDFNFLKFTPENSGYPTIRLELSAPVGMINLPSSRESAFADSLLPV